MRDDSTQSKSEKKLFTEECVNAVMLRYVTTLALNCGFRPRQVNHCALSQGASSYTIKQIFILYNLTKSNQTEKKMNSGIW
jgi:hypothetical protein